MAKAFVLHQTIATSRVQKVTSLSTDGGEGEKFFIHLLKWVLLLSHKYIGAWQDLKYMLRKANYAD